MLTYDMIDGIVYMALCEWLPCSRANLMDDTLPNQELTQASLVELTIQGSIMVDLVLSVPNSKIISK